MNDQKDYTKAFIMLAIGGVFMLFAVFSLPTLIISPQKFTTLFTLAVICLIAALGFLNGLATYAKKLMDRKNLLASIVLVSSMILSLYFSII
jgi:hypothetical protein